MGSTAVSITDSMGSTAESFTDSMGSTAVSIADSMESTTENKESNWWTQNGFLTKEVAVPKRAYLALKLFISCFNDCRHSNGAGTSVATTQEWLKPTIEKARNDLPTFIKAQAKLHEFEEAPLTDEWNAILTSAAYCLMAPEPGMVLEGHFERVKMLLFEFKISLQGSRSIREMLVEAQQPESRTLLRNTGHDMLYSKAAEFLDLGHKRTGLLIWSRPGLLH